MDNFSRAIKEGEEPETWPAGWVPRRCAEAPSAHSSGTPSSQLDLKELAGQASDVRGHGMPAWCHTCRRPTASRTG